MALSDGEQRRLDEIERALRSEDPGFAATITISRVRRHRALVAGVVFVLGMICLVAGLVTTDAALWAGIVIAVLGAVAMVAAALLYLRPRRLGTLTSIRRTASARRRRRR